MRKSCLPLILLFAASACLAITPGRASAQVSVDKVIFSFKPNEPPVTNLSVSNSSDSVIYVKTTAFEVEAPGEKGEKLTESDKVLISPKRFSVPANGQRVVRILVREKPGDTEKVFRASFMPVADEEGLQGLAAKASGKKTAALRVLTGMGILVFLQPRELKQDLVWERAGARFKISNMGNVNTFLDLWRACVAEQSTDCKHYTPTRLYPGGTAELEVPEDRWISFRKLVNEEYSTVLIPPQESVK